MSMLHIEYHIKTRKECSLGSRWKGRFLTCSVLSEHQDFGYNYHLVLCVSDTSLLKVAYIF